MTAGSSHLFNMSVVLICGFQGKSVLSLMACLQILNLYNWLNPSRLLSWLSVSHSKYIQLSCSPLTPLPHLTISVTFSTHSFILSLQAVPFSPLLLFFTNSQPPPPSHFLSLSCTHSYPTSLFLSLYFCLSMLCTRTKSLLGKVNFLLESKLSMQSILILTCKIQKEWMYTQQNNDCNLIASVDGNWNLNTQIWIGFACWCHSTRGLIDCL